MKNDPIHIIIIVLLLGISLGGCRAQKDLQRDQEVQRRIEQIERSRDSLRVHTTATTSVSRTIDDLEDTYRRTIELDTAGRVRSIQETWRERRSSDVSLQDDRTEGVSLSGSFTEKIKSDSTTTSIKEKINTRADSRLVQGADWVWVILSLVLVTAIIIYRVIER